MKLRCFNELSVRKNTLLESISIKKQSVVIQYWPIPKTSKNSRQRRNFFKSLKEYHVDSHFEPEPEYEPADQV